MHARIRAIAYHLPEAELTTASLDAQFPDWNVPKMDAASGIANRHVAAPGEKASDLAETAARKLFADGHATPGEIDFLLFCTQSPDYIVPTTACVLQHRLGLPKSCGALDFNLGHSGYVYGLGLAEGLIASGQARRVLLLTGETYTRYLAPEDKPVRTIFGDAGAATLLEADDKAEMGPFVYGTDGSGADKLMIPPGGDGYLRMNGPDVFTFTLATIPRTVAELLEKAGVALGDVDHFVFHQANAFILEHLRKRAKIPAEKFALALKDCGNTVSSSIPIALKEIDGRLQRGQRVMLVGYGAGLSWAAVLLRW